MTFADVFDLLLGSGVLAVAVTAVSVRRRETAVVLFLVFGVLLSMLWARLAAPDIALAEAALGAGVTGALLVDALASSRRSRSSFGAERDVRHQNPRGNGAERHAQRRGVDWGRSFPTRPVASRGTPARVAVWVGGVLAGGAILAILVVAAGALSEPEGALAERVAADLPDTGVEHGITAVLLNFRSYDTLLEVAVLAVAAFAALVFVGRSEPRWSDPWPATPPPALAALTQVLAPLAVLVAIWLLVAGTTRPGGAFQAGALLAAVLLMLHLGGRTAAIPRGGRLLTLVFVGLLAFLAVAAVTAAFGAGWLVLDPAWAGAVILAIEGVLALSIGVGLATVFVADRTGLPERGGSP